MSGLGSSHIHSQRPAAGLFTSVLDWELRVDLGRQFKFPVHIVAAALRPDVVLTSATLKHVLLIELTVPWEDFIEEANERKWSKYQQLVEESRRVD